MAERIATDAQLVSSGGEDLMAVRLRDTVARSVRACTAAEEIVRYSREAIATAGERVRSCQATKDAIRSACERRTQLQVALNAGGAGGRPADEPEVPGRTGC